MRRNRAIGLIGAVTASLLLWAVIISAASCASHTPPDTSQLSAQGHQDLKAIEVTKLVADADAAVIAANRAGKITDQVELQILGINKQVLDVLQAHPAGFVPLALTAVANSKQALPAEVQAVVDLYLAKVIAALQGVQ